MNTNPRLITKRDILKFSIMKAQYDSYCNRIKNIKPPVSFEVFAEVLEGIKESKQIGKH